MAQIFLTTDNLISGPCANFSIHIYTTASNTIPWIIEKDEIDRYMYIQVDNIIFCRALTSLINPVSLVAMQPLHCRLQLFFFVASFIFFPKEPLNEYRIPGVTFEPLSALLELASPRFNKVFVVLVVELKSELAVLDLWIICRDGEALFLLPLRVVFVFLVPLLLALLEFCNALRAIVFFLATLVLLILIFRKVPALYLVFCIPSICCNYSHKFRLGISIHCTKELASVILTMAMAQKQRKEMYH